MIERMASKSFTDLIVWQKAHRFVLDLYKYTMPFPKSEIYGLVSQMRRAAVSIPANIVEGFKRRSKLEKNRFFNISQGSLEESRYYLILSNDLGYRDSGELQHKLEEVSKMLHAYNNTMLTSGA
jgi:four helix bundle protein